MKLEDLGYDLKTGRHDKRLSHMESVFVGIIWTDHVGAENKISAEEFAQRYAYGITGFSIVAGSRLDHWKRQIRYLQNHILRKHDHVPVFSKAGRGGGYWIAGPEEDGEEFYHTFRERGMTGIVKASCGKKAAVIEAVEQLAFEFEDLIDKTEGIVRTLPRKKSAVAPEIVDALLSKMSQDPEKFAVNLRKIREKYFSGAVLLEKERLAAMQAKTKELQEMIGSLEDG